MPANHITLTADGIVSTDFGRLPLSTKELLEKSFARRRKLVSGPRPALVVIGGAFSATPAAHSYGEHTSALAMVGDYAVCKELVSLFAQLDKLAFPCRYFDHTDPALEWLRSLR